MAGNVGLGNDLSIPKLMEFLRNAFSPRHFEDVKEILINREEKWKVETERLKEENDLLRLDKIAIDTENEELKQLIFLVNRDRIAIRERKLLKEHSGAGVGEGQVTQVTIKRSELEKEKSTAEAAAVLWKNKFKELENDALSLGLEPPTVNNIEQVLRANDKVSENGTCNFPHVKIEAGMSDCNENIKGVPTCHSPKADISNSHEADSRGHRHHVFVEISDDDDDSELAIILPEKHMAFEKSPPTSQSKWVDTEGGRDTHKQKQDLEVQNSCADDNIQPSKRVCLQEMGRDELFLDAVCPLYRKEISHVGSTCSKHEGFIPSDALRGIELAKFLINGDEQGKRRKSAKELMEHDKEVVEDCRKIASRLTYTRTKKIHSSRLNR